jgi:hypothetical protein
LSIKDDKAIGTQDPILWSPKILLVPPSLNATALRIRNATEITMNTQVANNVAAVQTKVTNPKAGTFTVLSSPFIQLSGLTGAAADWLYGDFKAQFYWQDVWPIQVFSQGSVSQTAWERDIAAAFKVRYLGGIFANEHRMVVKVKGS